MKKFSINQDEDVWSQLLYGIRYLDLRVGYYKTTPEKFWIYRTRNYKIYDDDLMIVLMM